MKIRRIFSALFLAVTLALINTSTIVAGGPINVTSSSASSSYKAGDSISIQVVFSQSENVTGTPLLALNSGGTASYSSGSGSSTLNFNYTVLAGENSLDLDYVSINSLTLNGGSITDVDTGDPASLVLPIPGNSGSLSWNKDIVIDTTAPTVTNVTSSTSDGSYRAGQSISIQVTFSEAVVRTGTPTLALNSGGTASYISGSPSNIFTFTYTVAAGNTSADLDYSSTASLSGTIKDGAGNNANLTLPTVGGPNSLGGQKNIIIDTTAPTIAIGLPSQAITNSGPVTYTVTYADTNFNASTLSPGDITLNATGSATGTVGVSGSGSTRTVTISAISGNGTLGISIAAGTANDKAGNLAPSAGPSTTFTVDNILPTVTIGAPSSTATRTGPVSYTVTYADANFNSSTLQTSDITLNKTGSANGTVGLSGSGTSYTVTISGITGNGTLSISIAAGTASDQAGNFALAAGPSTAFTVDNTSPTVTINQADAQLDPTNTSPINFTVVFSEATTDFATGDVSLSGTAGATTATVTGSGTNYNVAVTGMASSGTVIANIAAGVAHDAAGNANTAGTFTDNTVTYDSTTLTVTINQAAAQLDPTNTSPIAFTVVFSKGTTDFATGDVSLSGTAGATTATVTGSGTTYNVAVTGMTTNGTIIANIPAGVAHDAAGNPNAASTSADNTVTYDTTVPTVTINQAVAQLDPTHTTPIAFTVVFSEATTDFATGDVSLSGTAGATTATVTGSGTSYSVAVSGMTSSGTVIANIAAGVAHDAAGNANTAGTFTDNTVTYDTLAPTVTINQASTQADPTNASPINFTVVFSEATTDFATGDVSLSGTAGATTAIVTGSGTTYNVAVTGMTTSGTVIANIAAGVAHDAAGNANTASTSSDNNVTYDSTDFTVTINQAAAQVDPARMSPINFTVIFNKVTTDFATGDVSLSGTAGATTATVTGSGTTYNVAVSGMLMNGTIIASIQAGVAHDTAGNANMTGTFTDNMVFYDTTAPFFSNVTPVSNTSINSITVSSAVSFTLSENVSSGSITMTRTGGIPDADSPHTCTLIGAALNSGSHNNLDLSDTTNACTVAQSLVSGAVYTFAFNATDLAGNPSAQVTRTNVTFENTVPIFSAVTPATNAFIRSITDSSNISYTLSKTIASGSITMTWTGGTGDAGSPHTCILKGTALNIGPHPSLDLSDITNSCTVAQSLVNGAVYTFTFNGIDSAGNIAPTVTSTDVTFDTTVPTASWIEPSADCITNRCNVSNQTIQISVDASDTTQMSLVVFKRYDYVNLVWLEIGRVWNPPYSITFDTSELLPQYNEIAVIAFDAANNSTFIWNFLYHLPVLTVNKAGTGIGTVTSSPDGIDCGATCSYGYNDDTVVTLTANPTSPSTFDGWSGACSGTGSCTLTMDAPKSVTATFTSHLLINLPLIFR